MKNIFKLILLATGILFIYSSCNKVDNLYKQPALPVYKDGVSPVLSSSTNSIAPLVADSDKAVVTFSWTNPKYANDSSTTKYIIEIDSTGRNFSQAVSTIVTGKLSHTFIAKEINAILLSFGFAFNTAYNVDVRVISSYANNNEQYMSNTVTMSMTPYLVPPIVMPPNPRTLYLVGSATAGAWNNPVPVPSQQFTMIDTVTYQGTFFLNGGGQYLMLPVSNGDWSHKYAVNDNSIPGLSAGGDFGYNVGNAFNSNFPGPATTGFYTITVDFQHGKFTVVPAANYGVYGLLYVPGDYQGWTPATAQTLGSFKNDGNYEGFINFPAGGTFQFKFTTTPDWSNPLGDAGGGKLSSSGGNITVPAAGYYYLLASTANNTWSATATNKWSLIGSFAASGWSNDVDLTYSAANNNWTGTITTAAGDQFKFRANHDWGLNLGESGTTGRLVENGDNIGDPSKNFAVPAGTHNITLFLGSSGYYTCIIQ